MILKDFNEVATEERFSVFEGCKELVPFYDDDFEEKIVELEYREVECLEVGNHFQILVTLKKESNE